MVKGPRYSSIYFAVWVLVAHWQCLCQLSALLLVVSAALYLATAGCDNQQLAAAICE
jgi:hypothetical protein